MNMMNWLFWFHVLQTLHMLQTRAFEMSLKQNCTIKTVKRPVTTKGDLKAPVYERNFRDLNAMIFTLNTAMRQPTLRPMIFFKKRINVFEKLSQEYNQTVKQFGSKSGRHFVVPDLGPNSRKLRNTITMNGHGKPK